MTSVPAFVQIALDERMTALKAHHGHADHDGWASRPVRRADGWPDGNLTEWCCGCGHVLMTTGEPRGAL